MPETTRLTPELSINLRTSSEAELFNMLEHQAKRVADAIDAFEAIQGELADRGHAELLGQLELDLDAVGGSPSHE